MAGRKDLTTGRKFGVKRARNACVPWGRSSLIANSSRSVQSGNQLPEFSVLRPTNSGGCLPCPLAHLVTGERSPGGWLSRMPIFRIRRPTRRCVAGTSRETATLGIEEFSCLARWPGSLGIGCRPTLGRM